MSQFDEEANDHPIAYFSRKLLPREQKYSTEEKECLAIRLAVRVFRVYFLGRPFKIQTDHRALQWLNRVKDTNAQLIRWSLALQPYHFVFEHRAGVKKIRMLMPFPHSVPTKWLWCRRRGKGCGSLVPRPEPSQAWERG